LIRFPFLLQDEATFANTLTIHGWKSNNAENSRRRIHGLDGTLLTLNEMRAQLWIQPQLLFYHYYANYSDRSAHIPAGINSNELLTESDFINAIRLSPSDAMTEDKEPYSPVIDGMTFKERDAKLLKVQDIVKKISDLQKKKTNLQFSVLKTYALQLDVQYPPTIVVPFPDDNCNDEANATH